MKKVLLGFALLVLVLGIAGNASASLYLDYESHTNYFNEDGETDTWEFNLDLDTLMDTNDVIESAYLLIDLGSILGEESVNMYLDGELFWDHKDLTLADDMSPITVTDWVKDDHTLTVTITGFDASFNDNFYVYDITLKGKYTKVDSIPDGGTAPVPEPATFLLLGSGLLGMVGIRRKKMK